jgi:hypothetical protein
LIVTGVTISFAGVLAKLAQQQTISNLIKGLGVTILGVALWEDSLMPASIMRQDKKIKICRYVLEKTRINILLKEFDFNNFILLVKTSFLSRSFIRP